MAYGYGLRHPFHENPVETPLKDMISDAKMK